MKINIITHLSFEHPLLMKDLLRGLSYGSDEQTEISKHFIRAEITQKEFIEKVQTIAMTEDSDIMIIYSSYYRQVYLWDLMEKMEIKALFISDGFYDYAKDRNKPMKNVSSLSMQLSECSYQLGMYANSKFSGKLGLVADFINSGYQAGYYLMEGFLSPNTPPLFQQVIAQKIPEEQYKTTIKQQLLATTPDVLFLNAAGKIGNTLLSLRTDTDVKEKLPSLKWLISDELLMELSNSEEVWDENMMGCSTLAPYSELTEEWQSEMKDKRSIFFALGYEAAITAKQIDSENQEDFEGPRGKIEWDSEQRRYKAEPKIVISRNGKVIAQKVDKVEEFPEIEKYGGWENPYLCY